MKYLEFYIALLFLTLSGNINAQTAWRHSTEIAQLTSDSIGQLYFKDKNGRSFLFEKQLRFKMISKIPESTYPGSDLELNKVFDYDNGLMQVESSCINILKDGESKQYCKSVDFSCLTQFNGNILLGTKGQGPWIFDGSTIRKFFIRGVYFPQDIADIQVSPGRLWILSPYGELYLFDTALQTLRKVMSGVDMFHIDPWEVIWTSEGAVLNKQTDFVNDHPPILEIISEENMILEDGRCMIEYNTAYSPDPFSLKLDYAIGAQEWKSQTGGDILRLEDLPLGSNRIKLRTHTSELYSKEQSINYAYNLAWWETYWPYIFSGLVGLIFLALLSQLLQARTRRRLQAETQVIRQELKTVQTFTRFFILTNSNQS